ncbi:unnamed protein product [Durusdinium trenchii]|uniref:AB hydrolase-1 domain-containing protein n=1 Tax=Durusdinium trenchii TaxID=1381693 RepID=A0ABP0NC14_9DINO
MALAIRMSAPSLDGSLTPSIPPMKAYQTNPHFCWRSSGSATAVGIVAIKMYRSLKRFRARNRKRVERTVLTDDLFTLPNDKVALEVLGGKAKDSVSRVSLVCIHGSYHAAWCYEAFYLDFFREHGLNAYALSLRGQGQGKMPDQLPVAGTLEEHASDVASFVRELEKEGQRVILLGHSFGGLITLKAAADLDMLAGLVLLCSVPPSGNVGIILRSLLRAPLQAFRITWGFISRAFERDAKLCQELFFDKETSLADVGDYMELMKKGCPPGTRLLDLRQLQGSLPVPVCTKPVLVLGGEMDVIVDAEAHIKTD